ncbi:class I SAM-dependent methyltransferase [Synechococcus sp. CBW1107]|uniref:class I SAM-dependent methyltransferase n=1 Tax=Synechococcus sp. CBW1107 TaxID=2789857 RepID=UPI002AD43EDC|nr:methyltransferase domain-containing protein [Synechococcus sp. CBW1107]CAK6696992.1 Ubiquinone biosynthesis O-methyltransferase, mitochondrial [Synechococcus sp. CBW1107]
MIDPNQYTLTPTERLAIDQQLAQVGSDPSLEQIWSLMDQAWNRCGCDNCAPDNERLARFYSDPVWLLNGMFIEQHHVSMGHRQAITAAVAALRPQQVVDVGGGFGTLARLLASALPQSDIEICEPYPPRHGIESCKPFANISFVPELSRQSVDVLVSTDVLEHVQDPIALLAAMVDAVRPGGHLLIANCFFPVIACHLPCTFHLRYSFNAFCRALGLKVLGPCEGSHATIYCRIRVLEPNWPRLRAMERRSKRLFPWRQWRSRHLSPWGHRARLAIAHPLHYPRKLRNAVRPVC